MTQLSSDALDFRGKVVLITGAGTAIGRAVAVAFARQGALLSIGDVNEAAAAETLDLVRRNGHEALFTRTDVSQESDVQAFVARTISRLGRLDCAFNNAGIAPEDENRKPLAMLDAALFDRLLSVDLRGVFLCMKYELQHMARAGRGTIVNSTGVAGLVAEAGLAGHVAAKHGVIGLTKVAALEYAAHGIRVNALTPGEEMAGPVLFLCSEAASYVTGQVHIADGAATVQRMFAIDLLSKARAGASQAAGVG